ncbi:MAG: regulatory protein RecX [Nitrospirae bacterium]|nr:regulatory protein RecX [Nitrospirota bacterium]
MRQTPNINSYAFKLLSIRDRSEGELMAKLKEKGYSPDLIAETIGQLKSSGFIDDRKTAESITRYCKDGKLLGENGTKYYLKKRGIPGDIIAELSYSPDEQMERAKILIAKKERSLKKLPVKVKISRLYGQLQRKGYVYDIIQKAIREYEHLSGVPETEKADMI